MYYAVLEGIEKIAGPGGRSWLPAPREQLDNDRMSNAAIRRKQREEEHRVYLGRKSREPKSRAGYNAAVLGALGAGVGALSGSGGVTHRRGQGWSTQQGKASTLFGTAIGAGVGALGGYARSHSINSEIEKARRLKQGPQGARSKDLDDRIDVHVKRKEWAREREAQRRHEELRDELRGRRQD